MRSPFEIYSDAFRELAAVPGVFARMVAQDVKLPPSERIRYGKHRRNYMLVWEVADGVKPRDTVIYFIHGGGWRVGAPERRRLLVKLFTDLGYPVMAPSYRVTPGHAFPELHTDTFRAFLEALHHPFAEKRNFIVIGESAGANLGALLAFDQESQQRYEIEHERIKGLVSVVGVLDMEPLPDTFVVRDYSGPRGGAMFKRANPMYMLNESVNTPVLAVHGDNDGLVPHASAVNFINYLNEVKPGLGQAEIVPGGTHVSVATDWYLNETPLTRLILDWIEERS